MPEELFGLSPVVQAWLDEDRPCRSWDGAEWRQPAARYVDMFEQLPDGSLHRVSILPYELEPFTTTAMITEFFYARMRQEAEKEANFVRKELVLLKARLARYEAVLNHLTQKGR